MFTAVIIDDEKVAREMLSHDIQNYCPDIQILGLASNFTDAYELLDAKKPDIVFLDIELNDSDGGGIELLEMFPQGQFTVIFFTGYDKYVQESYRLNAAYYVKKPISIEVLKDAVAKAQKQVLAKQKPRPFYRLSTVKGFEFIKLSDIMYLEADGAVTNIYTQQKDKKISSETLGEITKKLPTMDFFKIHRSYIVNRNFVRAYQKDGIILLSDQTQIPVSHRNAEGFLEWFQQPSSL